MNGPFCTYHKIYFTSENVWFVFVTIYNYAGVVPSCFSRLLTLYYWLRFVNCNICQHFSAR